MARDLKENLEEEEDIEPIADETNIQSGPPLTSGHLPFNEMGIAPPPEDKVMDISKFTINHLKNRVVER